MGIQWMLSFLTEGELRDDVRPKNGFRDDRKKYQKS